MNASGYRLSYPASYVVNIEYLPPGTMGVEKVVLKQGNGCDIPKKHDEVSMEYTGSTIFSPAKADVSYGIYRLAVR